MGYAINRQVDDVMSRGYTVTRVCELDCKRWHDFANTPPDQWAAARGATHTLFTLDGTRPARLLRTVAYVGINEDENGAIVWEKWRVRH